MKLVVTFFLMCFSNHLPVKYLNQSVVIVLTVSLFFEKKNVYNDFFNEIFLIVLISALLFSMSL